MAEAYMNRLNILGDLVVERRRRLQGLLVPDPHALVLWRCAFDSLTQDSDLKRLAYAFEFAKAIKYHHVGLTSDIYFSHPLRVAGLAILLSDMERVETGVLAILHNVLEVSDVSLDMLSAAFGGAISNQIQALTVDREFQWDSAYKKNYYEQLMQGPISARIVKIIDKLDNLFVLGLNSDAILRSRYLAEIEEYILPMTVTSLPTVTAYMRILVEDCRATGFIEWPLTVNLGKNEPES
jgi:(p)ppGpp synthase/HD superfamily hydrolase